MATEIKLWEVQNGKLQPVQQGEFATEHLEKELEDWIAQTPALVGEDLLIIAQQCVLPGVGILDLLAIDGEGTFVIIELKRDSTPREAVAQALHYASWLDTATEDQVVALAEGFLQKDLGEAFQERFGRQMPTLVCQNHRIILVAPKLDAAAEGIVNYLAERYGVAINAIFFTYAKVGTAEILTRAFLVAEDSTHPPTKGRFTVPQLITMASERNILPLVEICRAMNKVWGEDPSRAYGGSFRFWAVAPDGKSRMICGVNIADERAQARVGELDVWIPTRSMAEVTGLHETVVREVLTNKHRLCRSTPSECVVRLRTQLEAEALTAQLKLWSELEPGKKTIAIAAS